MNDAVLPEGWCFSQISDIADVKGGKRLPKGEKFSDSRTLYPYLRVSDFLNGTIDQSKLKYISETTYSKISVYTINAEDLYISIAGTIGLVGIIPRELDGANLTENAAKICNLNCVDQNYLSKLLGSIYCKQQFIDNTVSSGQPKLALFRIKGCEVPLAPLAEQKEISARLDNLLAQVDSIKTRLDAIPAILKRFRKSVLAAAVSGKFTEEYRDVSYAEWRSVKLEEVANIIDPHPSHRTPKEVPEGVPYIGIGDLNQDGSINFSGARKVSAEVLKDHNARYSLKKGDFVFGKIGTLGRATVLPTDRDYTLSANVILIQPLEGYVLPKFLMYFLSSPATMDEVTRQSNSTSQAAFGIKKMRAFNCRIPSLEEQSEIAQRVEKLFAFADQVEQRVKDSQSRVNKLTQSILAKAFRGELTVDWRAEHPELISGENSAQALLERIKAEQEKLAPQKKGRRKRT